MAWYRDMQSDPRYGHYVRLATGRPPWVLKATAVVAVVTFAIPLIALALLLLAALAVTAVAWVIFSFFGKLIDALTGKTVTPEDLAPRPAPDDGRENVRVVER
ncbi:MAG: hypothetical protein ACIAXF_03750 [Phycisphaerales bacterium JB063]